MPERVHAEVLIGGTTTRETAQGLLDAAEHDGVGYEAGSSYLGDLQTFITSVREDRALLLVDDQASGGEMVQIESYCEAHNLAYIRYSEGGTDFSSEVSFWKPGMDHARTIDTSHDHDPVIYASELAPILEAHGEGGSADEALEQIRALLHSRTIPETVPPFRVAEAPSSDS